MQVIDVLKGVSFGQRVAEEEGDSLAAYFVETDQWQKVFSDQVDIVYGPKGSGKSALYFLLIAKQSELFDRGVLLCPGENPRGSPAFKSLVIDPPATEAEFIALWKLYLICLLSAKLDDYGIVCPESTELKNILIDCGLVTRGKSFQSLLQSAFEYVKRILRPAAFETGVQFDPASQMPSGLSAKITFSEPGAVERKRGKRPVDELLELGDTALKAQRIRMWQLLDRLDVAFLDSQSLEENALRALFRVYLDLLVFKNIRLKLFLRTDIWNRITAKGFREASHITRSLTIEWNRASLENLIVKRIVQNHAIMDYYHTTPEEVLQSSKSQDGFIYKVFPEQPELGSRRSTTLDWMLSRTRDGTKKNAPRELIHFLNSLRDVQVRRLEVGDAEPEENRLFARTSFKDALPEVSRVRLEQTLFAEYPEFKPYVEKLKGEKAQHTIESLTAIWKEGRERAGEAAKSLVEVGFFEQRGDRELPVYWVPPLYRVALEMIQGAAD
jgi:hypothetical protein